MPLCCHVEFSERINVPHNAVHGAVGCDMGIASYAAYDPIFWLHHSYVDHLFAFWQELQKERSKAQFDPRDVGELERDLSPFNWNNNTFESVWQLLVVSIIGTLALVVTTNAYQLLDPTICGVLCSQEVLLGFIVQAYFFKDPVGIWNIFGGSLILISGVCISSESFFHGLYQKIRGYLSLPNEEQQ